MKHVPLVCYRPEYQESVPALHRSAIHGFATGIRRAVAVDYRSTSTESGHERMAIL